MRYHRACLYSPKDDMWDMAGASKRAPQELEPRDESSYNKMFRLLSPDDLGPFAARPLQNHTSGQLIFRVYDNEVLRIRKEVVGRSTESHRANHGVEDEFRRGSCLHAQIEARYGACPVLETSNGQIPSKPQWGSGVKPYGGRRPPVDDPKEGRDKCPE
ncbi:hypothetical protein GUJ93_ZPchr0002g23665 [Zizania palustris]|uniref:Uncharacterized protein n=1 Tax=Zizania palustris TaxID=103762 RepID=A0A8J5S605_ZIZPA|nr:hypothetical protein GUJ93_ZPchr0002g23665 [Zizania palustris]